MTVLQTTIRRGMKLERRTVLLAIVAVLFVVLLVMAICLFCFVRRAAKARAAAVREAEMNHVSEPDKVTVFQNGYVV